MSEKIQNFITKVYTTVAGALLLSGLTSFLTSQNANALTLISQKPVWLGLLIAEFALVITLSLAWNQLSPAVAAICLGLYAIVNGLTLSSIFLVYELGSVVTIFFACAALFLGLAFFARTTKMDVSRWGNICLVGLIITIIVGLINIFIGSSLLELILCITGIILFIGLTIYDQRKVLEIANSGSDNLNRYVVPLALSLYLDFINLFVRLLQLFGRRKD